MDGREGYGVSRSLGLARGSNPSSPAGVRVVRCKNKRAVADTTLHLFGQYYYIRILEITFVLLTAKRAVAARERSVVVRSEAVYTYDYTDSAVNTNL